MIDIPSGSNPASTTSASVVSSAPDAVKALVLAKLDAVVQTVQARVDSGQPEKPTWDILLKLNPQTSTATPLKTDAITPELLRSLQSGQTLLLQTRASQPLPEGTRLQVNISIANGVQIQSVQLPNPLPTQQLTQLKQFIHQQQPVQPLLANLLQLLQQSRTEQIAALPLQTQIAIRNLINALPNPQQAQNSGQLKQWIENSGLLQEVKIANVLKQAQAQDTALTPAKNGANVSNSKAEAPNVNNTKPLVQIRQQLQDWVQRLKPEADNYNASHTKPGSPASVTTDALLNTALNKDLKHLFQQLEKQLQTTRPTSPEANADVKAAPNETGPAAGAKSAGPPLPTAEVMIDRKTGLPIAGHGKASPLPADALTAAATPSKSPLAIQRYQAGANANVSAKSVTDSTTPDLIPPLPGQVVVQAQPRMRASLKQNDLADAIVKTLLAQVRGAIARTTLHQLSSHSARQESATPTTLSFELPFLHNSQIEVFQFRIDEEPDTSPEQEARQQAKRWVVQMGFDIEGLGPMFCQLSLTGKSMAVNFWAAWEQTLSNTKAHFNFLEQALQGMGIRVEKIQAQLGMPEIDKTGVRNQLVDIKT